MKTAPQETTMHATDADCTVDPSNDTCTTCGVHHGDPCPACAGRGFHADGCATCAATKTTTAATRAAEEILSATGATSFRFRVVAEAVAAGSWHVVGGSLVEVSTGVTLDDFVAGYQITQADMEAGVEVQTDRPTGPRVIVAAGFEAECGDDAIERVLRVLPSARGLIPSYADGFEMRGGRMSYPLVPYTDDV